MCSCSRNVLWQDLVKGDDKDLITCGPGGVNIPLGKLSWNASCRVERGLWNLDVVSLIVAATSKTML